MSPETAHYWTMRGLRWACAMPFGRRILIKLFVLKNPKLERNVLGLRFPNPVGLAAGFDKDGKYVNDLTALGFGFIEIGTVTPRPQSGNPKPRLFRLPTNEALINRMGFNNEGVEALAERLKTSDFRHQILDFGKNTEGSKNLKSNVSRLIIGGNIGKNKLTPNADAAKDYEYCFERLFDLVDYFVVNVSSPNTPDLRALQEKEPLSNLLAGLQKLNQTKPKPKPILLKIAPDLNTAQLDDILEIVESNHLSGIIATNTTISRENLLPEFANVENIGAGGLSGKPLRDRSTDVIRYLRARTHLVIVGVGGIHSAEDALEKLAAGADLIQIYTGLVYEGPSLIKKINQALVALD